MAEVKNTFIQSKMNQDLDGRIIPNGQYRFGKNVSISRSDAADVGALENVLGTNFITSFELDDCAFDIIGHFVDQDRDRIYFFITDYTDNSPSTLANNTTGVNSSSGLITPSSSAHNSYIAYFDAINNTGGLLVGGDFLNFAKNYPITGVNVIEDLLFWTDNRNQPRKININTALNSPFILNGAPGYYTDEDHISVAKYYPFECISLLKKTSAPEQWKSTMENVTDPYLPVYCVGEIDVPSGGLSFELEGVYTNLEPGVKAGGPNIVGNNVLITSVTPDTPVGSTTVVVDQGQTLAEGDLIYFSFANPLYDAAWPGDKNFLSDKFVRFSYRYKFDDGEYSLLAPFTQACFVPKQDGYFINNNLPTVTPPVLNTGVAPPNIVQDVSTTLLGDEGRAYDSTIVDFFENKIQNIGLQIPCASVDNNRIDYDTLGNTLKVIEIDIIYKDSESNTAYILDTIEASEFDDLTSDFYNYDYQSREPWKTLPASTLLRVYDKVPIRALAQEASGNRIMYGNYIDKHTSPDRLAYVTSINEKPIIPVADEPKEDFVRKEYQNHTVKQNRTYQVGVILSDRYGRQSDVILSSIYSESLGGYGSTIFHDYRNSQNGIITSTDTWPGDMITMTWHDVIPKTIDKEGYPGLYQQNNGTLIGLVDVTSSGWGCYPPFCPKICSWTLTITGAFGSTAIINIEDDGSGSLNWDSMVVISSDNTWQENEPIISIVNDTGMALLGCEFQGFTSGGRAVTLRDQNTLGWYSWKIVVKQTQQDYYNVYLPGMLAGWPHFIVGYTEAVNESGAISSINYPQGDDAVTAFTVLTGDNINKVPRNMEDPGPTQKLFGSEVKLFGRVENVKANLSGTSWTSYNRNYNPGVIPDTVPVIGNLLELNLGVNAQAGVVNAANKPTSYPTSLATCIPIHFYNGSTDPLVAKLSTKKQIGWPMFDQALSDLGMVPYLSIYETSPVISNLDIYWETSTSGLIDDLNFNIINVDNTIPTDIQDPSIDLIESQAPNTICSGTFCAIAANGTNLCDPINQTTIALIGVYTNADPSTNVMNKFQFEQILPLNEYQLKTANDPHGYFLAWADDDRRIYNFTFQVNRPAIGSSQAQNFTVTKIATVQNAAPLQGETYYFPSSPPPWDTKQSLWDCAFPMENVWKPYDPWTGNVKFAPSMVSYSDITYADNCGCCGTGDWCANGDFFTPENEWEGACYEQCDTFSLSTSDMQYRNQYDYTCWCGHINCNGSSWGGTKIGPCCTTDYGMYTGSAFASMNDPQATGLTPRWNGQLKAANGAYGSPGNIFPRNPNHGQELVWSVPRAYQVSAFFEVPMFQEGNPQLIYGADPCNEDSHLCDMEMKFRGEIVFGEVAMTKRLAPAIYNYEDDRTTIQDTYSFGGHFGIPVPGPVYYDFEYSATGTLDPQDYNGLGAGENVVGQRYMTPATGRIHYWTDLTAAAVDYPDMRNIRVTTDFSPNPKWGFYYVNEVKVDTAPGEYEVSLQQASFDWSSFLPDPSLGIGGNNAFVNPGLASPSFETWTNNAPVPDYTNNFGFLVSKGVNTMPWPVDYDHPIPPGRYVVTVRVTDRSAITNPYPSSPATQIPSGVGLYYEWDIPLVVACPFVVNNHKTNTFPTLDSTPWA
jgi:hypothetical protein